MGSCVSCLLNCCGTQDDNLQFGESGDRAQLIDPNSDNVTIQRIQSENYYCRYLDNGYPKKSEEHSDLNKILQDMASNVIDVASLGSHSLEQPEYRERMGYYVNKIRSLTLTKSFAKLPKNSILLDVPNPEKMFSSVSLVTNEELQSIGSMLNEVDNLLDDMNIGSFDDLIIPFQVRN